MCFSEAMDMINSSLVDHHKQVAYISFSIASEIGLSSEEQNNLILAGLLHDSGALYLEDRLSTLEFELENPQRHAETGYLLLKNFAPFSKLAPLVRYHHIPWECGKGIRRRDEEINIGCHILHLADRISVLIQKQKNILTMTKEIYDKIKVNSGEIFMPELVLALKDLTKKEFFWLDAASSSIGSILASRSNLPDVELNMKELISLAKFFCQIIDFRSHFTATHTSGVAATAEALAGLANFSDRECQIMKVAGYLHDLGKLAVPTEILEKPGSLSYEDFSIVRSHTYYTYRTLENIAEFDIINNWASFHHERMDGRGYPFHLKKQDLSLGSRIMALADVFTALSEDRPYRKGMSPDRAMKIIEEMANNSSLDKNILSLLRDHFDEINTCRTYAQEAARKEYKDFEEIILNL